MSTSRIVEGIEYGPAVTVVRNADGTLERVKEGLQKEIALGSHDAEANRKARQARQRLLMAKQRKIEEERAAARQAKIAIQTIA